MRQLFLVILTSFVLCSCSSSKNEKCGLPLYGDEYYNNVNINPDYPCVIDTCGKRVCNTYDDNKDQYRNYYMSSPCNQK